MPQFVLLRHECPPSFGTPSHWDLMLEWHGALRTWQLQTLPATWAKVLGASSRRSSVKAVLLPDHRIEYLTYEGPLTDDRGTVQRVDEGTFDIIEKSPDLLAFHLTGGKLRGLGRLVRETQTWTLRGPDERESI